MKNQEDFRNFRDRDYIQDVSGDIYQVIGSIHPPNHVWALQKYKLVSNSDKIGEDILNFNDPISKFKNHPLRIWIKKPIKTDKSNEINKNEEKFIRILPNYSSIAAKDNINSHTYMKHSEIFDIPLIQIPYEKIGTYFNPILRLKKLIDVLHEGTFEEKQQLDDIEQETLEVIFSLEDKLGLNIKNIGITGSILWEGHHELSDIDIMIYGQSNLMTFLRNHENIPRETTKRRALRKFTTSEILPIAQKMEIKTGLTMEECFEYICKKPYLLFYTKVGNKKRKVSITFAPTIEEIVKYPLFTLNSQIISKFPIKIKAKIISSQWGYYYPGLFEIEVISTQEGIQKDNDIDISKITRLVVYEHEMVGFYKNGDEIDISGLLQECKNVPDIRSLEEMDGFQILVGGHETFGKEYIRLIN